MSEVSAAVAWLERGYDEPGMFQWRSQPWLPGGLFQIKPDHDCLCWNPRYATLWMHSDVASKWRASKQ